jgi:hypothetical protein
MAILQVLGDVRAWQGEIYMLSDRKIYVAATRLPQDNHHKLEQKKMS